MQTRLHWDGVGLQMEPTTVHRSRWIHRCRGLAHNSPWLGSFTTVAMWPGNHGTTAKLYTQILPPEREGRQGKAREINKTSNKTIQRFMGSVGWHIVQTRKHEGSCWCSNCCSRSHTTKITSSWTDLSWHHCCQKRSGLELCLLFWVKTLIGPEMLMIMLMWPLIEFSLRPVNHQVFMLGINGFESVYCPNSVYVNIQFNLFRNKSRFEDIQSKSTHQHQYK